MINFNDIFNSVPHIENVHPTLLNESNKGQTQSFDDLVRASHYNNPASSTSGRSGDSTLAQTINSQANQSGPAHNIESSPMFIKALGGDRIIASDTNNATAVSYANTLNDRAAQMRSLGSMYGQTSYGQGMYGQNVAGQAMNSQATYGQVFGQSMTDQRMINQNMNGQSAYGQSAYGQSPYSQGAYGQGSNQSPFGQSSGSRPTNMNYVDYFNQQLASTNSPGTTISHGVKELITRNSSNPNDREINTEARQVGRDLRSLANASGINTTDLNRLLGQFTTLADAGYNRASASEIAYDADNMRATLQRMIGSGQFLSTNDQSKLSQALQDTTLLSGSLVKRAYQSQTGTSSMNCFGSSNGFGAGNYNNNANSNVILQGKVGSVFG